MTITVHQTIQTMSGQGLEALSPNGMVWIALFDNGSLSLTHNDSLTHVKAELTDEPTLALDEAA